MWVLGLRLKVPRLRCGFSELGLPALGPEAFLHLI